MYRTLLTFALGVIFVCVTSTSAEDKPTTSRTIKVAVYSDKGAGRSVKDLLKALAKDPKLVVKKINAQQVRDGELRKFDVVIHPGGSGGRQGRNLKAAGRKKVREFVRAGGGYVGFCAGAYLATNDYAWSLNILDAKVLDKKHWARGWGVVRLGLTEEGRKFFGKSGKSVSIYYHQGPILAPNRDAKVPDYKTLATFETEVTKKNIPGGVMVGKTAICRGTFGRGRVFCFSPHPEKTKGMASLVHRSVRWAAGQGE